MTSIGAEVPLTPVSANYLIFCRAALVSAAMPVEFLNNGEAAAYGRFSGAPSQAQLERFFFLDLSDRALVAERVGHTTALASPFS